MNSEIIFFDHELWTPREEIAFTSRQKTLKFLGMAEAYFVCHINPIKDDFL